MNGYHAFGFILGTLFFILSVRVNNLYLQVLLIMAQFKINNIESYQTDVLYDYIF